MKTVVEKILKIALMFVFTLRSDVCVAFKQLFGHFKTLERSFLGLPAFKLSPLKSVFKEFQTLLALQRCNKRCNVVTSVSNCLSTVSNRLQLPVFSSQSSTLFFLNCPLKAVLNQTVFLCPSCFQTVPFEVSF